MPREERNPDGPQWAFALALGFMMSLAARGYQFGESNHTVYLVAALKGWDPALLTNDWWVNSTFQQHGAFTLIARALLAIHVLALAWGFLVGYLLLVILLHVLWFLITRLFGGSWRTYLLSVTLFYLSGGGFVPGFYEFLQDGAFLPSNVANVAMLAGFLAWTTNRPLLAGIALGTAGLFHLNHAIVALFTWGVLSAWPSRPWDHRPGFVGVPPPRFDRNWAAGTVILGTLCLLNLAPSMWVILGRQGSLPLDEFVTLYVRIRHPHHYDPSTWPVAVWVSFLWPAPFAALAWRSMTPDWRRQDFSRQWLRILLVLSVAFIAALLGAGIWYGSESLVQLSLYRFGIYLKLLTCIGTAIWLTDPRRSPLWRKAALLAAVVALSALAISGLAAGGEMFELIRLNRLPLAWIILLSLYPLLPPAWRPERQRSLGLSASVLLIMTGCILLLRGGDGLRFSSLPRDDADYLALCGWVEKNTPVDAIFLVPPDEESFRLHARRAIVVNFKGVPQLSGELIEWRERLEAVLDARLDTLPRRFDLALAKIEEWYDAVRPSHLLDVAKVYDASYIVLRHRAEPTPRLELKHTQGEYLLYRVLPATSP